MSRQPARKHGDRKKLDFDTYTSCRLPGAPVSLLRLGRPQISAPHIPDPLQLPANQRSLLPPRINRINQQLKHDDPPIIVSPRGVIPIHCNGIHYNVIFKYGHCYRKEIKGLHDQLAS